MVAPKLRITVVGLHFGECFVPIYQLHPDVETVVICDVDEHRLQAVGDKFEVQHRLSSLDAVLADPSISAVHLLTPVFLHAEQSVRVLEAGKHCACAVVMALSLDEISRVIRAQKTCGRNYMMMETAVYCREFFFVQDLLNRGEFGELTFLRGMYFQDIEGYPDYWKSVPPMMYATHVIAPLLALAKSWVRQVCCMGSGRVSPRLLTPPHSPFRLETAILRLENGLAAEVTRSWFETARPYVEAFSVYGSRRSFEWNQHHEDAPAVFELNDRPTRNGRGVSVARPKIPDYADRLPPSLRRFTYYESNEGHGGSHPHLAHEFVRSIVEQRPPVIDVITAANWTAPGICAHQSAMNGGQMVDVPLFNEPSGRWTRARSA